MIRKICPDCGTLYNEGERHGCSKRPASNVPLGTIAELAYYNDAEIDWDNLRTEIQPAPAEPEPMEMRGCGAIHNEEGRHEYIGEETAREWTPECPDYYMVDGIDVRRICDHLSFNRGSAIKYILRAGRKPGNVELIELMKAVEVLGREIARLQGKNTI